jgi:hypothetical protein
MAVPPFCTIFTAYTIPRASSIVAPTVPRYFVTNEHRLRKMPAPLRLS